MGLRLRIRGDPTGGLGAVHTGHTYVFLNPIAAESLLDRLINTSHQVITSGPSYWLNKPPKDPTDKPSRLGVLTA
ncbi:hypothetical protein ACH47Z_39330 [Streptomyces sp. NPDC020192]|uniref:hypothetical protein n=1 Tax=Streptomyces sp. NPDC020192 TaxID=3365066 RepID=UPI0037B9C168